MDGDVRIVLHCFLYGPTMVTASIQKNHDVLARSNLILSIRFAYCGLDQFRSIRWQLPRSSECS